MVLNQTKFCMKCHETKYFCMTFHLLKYYLNQNLDFNYVIKIITCAIFNVNFF